MSFLGYWILQMQLIGINRFPMTPTFSFLLFITAMAIKKLPGKTEEKMSFYGF